MKKTTFFFLFLLFLGIQSHSQTPVFQKIGKILNEAQFYGSLVSRDNNGDFILWGNLGKNLVGKVNQNGDTINTMILEGTNCLIINPRDSTHFLFGVSSYGAGMKDGFVARLNSDNDTLWSKSYGYTGNELANTFIPVQSGGYVFTLYAHPDGGNLFDPAEVAIVRINEDGDTLWTKIYGGENSEYASVYQALDGNFLFMGFRDTIIDNRYFYSIYLFKTDTSGNLMWTRTYKIGDRHTYAYKMILNPDGTCLFIGASVIKGTYEQNGFIIALDSAGGNVLWAKNYSDISDTVWTPFDNVTKTIDDGYIIGGFYGSASSTETPMAGMAIKTDAIGNIAWSMAYGDTDLYNSDVQQIFECSDSTYMLSCHKVEIGGNTGREMYLIKADKEGKTSCNYYTVDIVVSDITDSIVISAPPTLQSFVPMLVGNAPIQYSKGSNFYYDTLCTGFVGVEKIQEQNFLLKVYPNPSEGKFFLERDENNLSNEKIEVYNLLGVKIFSERSSSSKSIEINISGHSSGIYILRCGNYSGKIVKM